MIFSATPPEKVTRASMARWSIIFLRLRGANAKILAQDLGHVLVRKVSPLFKDSEISATFSESSASELPNPYTIIFANFCDDGDVLEIEEYLVAFSGYRHYRPIRAAGDAHVTRSSGSA